MKKLLKKSAPGVIAYVKDKAIGWCAVSPSDEYIRLETSRILKPVDDKKVCSVSCFFIAKEFRGKELSVPLLKAAVDFAISKGATIVEGYPTEPKPPPPAVPKRREGTKFVEGAGRYIWVDRHCRYFSKSRV